MKRYLAVLLLAVGVASGSFGATAQVPPSAEIAVEAISNRADLVSGGDLLLRVGLPEGVDPREVTVAVDGREQERDLHPDPKRDGYFVRLNGLAVGHSNVSVAGGPYRSELDVTNHPIGGPVIAGAQVQPWFCATTENELGPPQDAQCNTATVYEYKYRSSVTRLFSDYDPANPPPDVATTTTDHGVTVPYIVRVERGVMDRGIYEIAVLFDPGKPWEPWAPQEAFNGKALIPFGGGCQPRHSQAPPSDVMDDAALSRGFAVMNSGLNVLGQSCSDVVSAEAVMMLKEHFIESYGQIRYTIGNGWSGGSMQQLSLASNYPGLLDGIQPGATFPDVWEAIQEAEDCFLMDRYFDRSPHLWLTPQDQADVAGYQAPTTCRSLWDLPGTNGYARTWFDPDNHDSCFGDIAGGISAPAPRPEWTYDADTNPNGARCTVQDYNVAVYGRRAEDGFARRPFDNVGVQYGLRALEAGEISAKQFVDLNERIGGIDIDWNWQPERSEADVEAVEIAYRSGRVTSMREVRNIPVIDMPLPMNLEVHTPFHSFVVRERLKRSNGHAGNHVLRPFADDSLTFIDRWLTAIEADGSEASLEVKVVRNKPDDLVDACGIYRLGFTDPALCETAFPHYADPRLVAGAPPTDDVLKCRLRTPVRTDYGVNFTDEQWDRLMSAFATGVCDYSKPSVGQVASEPWTTFSEGPGGRPLGDAPRSSNKKL